MAAWGKALQKPVRVMILPAALVLACSLLLPGDNPAAGDNGSQSSNTGQVIVKEGGGPPPPPPPCDVSIGMRVSHLTYGGLPRNNPDGTYYPGDAFSLSLAVSSRHCTSVSTMLSGSPGVSIQCPKCTSTRVDISPAASAGSHTVTASAFGTGQGGSGSARASLSVIVADPMMTIKAVPANVTDADGYLMRNHDGTHYINDAVALKYKVDYRFKDARKGILEPEVTRTHPYPRIADLDCLQESCILTVPATAAISQYSGSFAYATGISVANATASQGLGPEDFQFDVRLKNAGAYTGMRASVTHTVRIVDYAPVFAAAYPYLDLKKSSGDGGGGDGDRSYEKKLMIGVHYLGSYDATADGGDGEVKPLRRAKLNMYTDKVSALAIGSANSTAADASRQALLTWVSVSSFHAGEAQGHVSMVTKVREPGRDAMIERAGYAKVAMKMAGYANDPNAFMHMQNVTASPAFYSKDFAGKGMVKLFAVQYTYPDTYFANTITARVLLDGNSVQAASNSNNDYSTTRTNIRLEARPSAGSTTTVCEYYDRHALYLTGDPVFSEMALSDVYPCSAAVLDGGAGVVVVEMRANKTGIIIPKIHGMLYPGGVAALPPHVALSSPSSIMLQMSVSGKTRTYDLVLYAHDRDAEIIANISRNNILEVSRDGATSDAVIVKSPASFGMISGLQVNGKDAAVAREGEGKGGRECSDRCTLDIPGSATIVAINEWGGRATGFVAEPANADSPLARTPDVLAENNGQNFILAAFAAAGALVAGMVFKKYVSWLGDAFY